MILRASFGLLLLIVLCAAAFADEPAAPQETGSTIPVSPEAVEKKQVEVDDVRVSVIPAYGYDASSIPVGHPRCQTGRFCFDYGMGGRVKFWFVTFKMGYDQSARGPSFSNLESGNAARGFGGDFGMFFVRRHKHGYYEFRNVIGMMSTHGSQGQEANTLHSLPSTHAVLDNGAYLSLKNGDLEKHPFSPILGLRASARSQTQTHFPTTMVFDGAVQLGAGFVLNRDDFSNKLTASVDLFRTTIAMMDEDERGDGTAEGPRVMQEGLKGFELQETFASGPFVLTSTLGRASYNKQIKETVWRGTLDMMVRVTKNDIKFDPSRFDHSLFIHFTGGFSRYDADFSTDPSEGGSRRLKLRDLTAGLGIGLTLW